MKSFHFRNNFGQEKEKRKKNITFGASSKLKVIVHLFPSSLGKVYFAAVIFKLDSLEGWFRELNFHLQPTSSHSAQTKSCVPWAVSSWQFFHHKPTSKNCQLCSKPSRQPKSCLGPEGWGKLPRPDPAEQSQTCLYAICQKHVQEAAWGICSVTAFPLSFSYWGWQWSPPTITKINMKVQSPAICCMRI